MEAERWEGLRIISLKIAQSFRRNFVKLDSSKTDTSTGQKDVSPPKLQVHACLIMINANANANANANSSSVITHTAELEVDHFLDPSNELVKGIADKIRQSVRDYTSRNHVKLIGIIASRSFPPSGAVIDSSADTYSQWLSKTCCEDGIDYETWRVSGGTSNTIQQVENLIARANALNQVHGILVYYPLYNKPYVLGLRSRHKINTSDWSIEQQQHNIALGCEDILNKAKLTFPGMYYKTRDDFFRNSVDASKDVEGLGAYYHRRRTFFKNQYVDRHDELDLNALSFKKDECLIFPCTALAVVKILKQCLDTYDLTKPVGQRLGGVTVTVINRSEILGRPLASLLSNDGARVNSIDVDSIVSYKPNGRINKCAGNDKTVQSCVEESSVVVTAVPSSTFKLSSEWLQDNATIINVASEPNVDEDELRKLNVTYFPQIGKITVALLERNLIQLHQRYSE